MFTEQYGQIRLVLHRLREALFVLRPVELPLAQRNTQSDQNQRRNSNKPKLGAMRHAIIQSMKYLVFIAFVAILGSLIAALVFMMNGSSDETTRSKRMAKSLAIRVGLSIMLFASILLAWKLGLIEPTGRP